MGIKTRITPISRSINLVIEQMLSAEARSAKFAAAAQEILDDADQTNRQILGRIPRNKTYVDGRQGAALATVKPEGVIVREYDLMNDVMLFIAAGLRQMSPVGRGPDKRAGHPGYYRESHTLFADGVEIPKGAQIPEASEYIFLSLTEYSRRVEKRSTVYEFVAAKANRRFGNIARVQFTYRGIVGGMAMGKSGSVTRKRETGRWKGRFAKMGGPKAQNVAAVRFPAIIVTPR